MKLRKYIICTAASISIKKKLKSKSATFFPVVMDPNPNCKIQLKKKVVFSQTCKFSVSIKMRYLFNLFNH